MIKIIQNAKNADTAFTRKPFASNREDAVKNIIEDVKKRGDASLFELCERFDGAKLQSLIVSQKEIDDAFCRVDAKFIEILKEAKANIEEYHTRQLREGFEIKKADGRVLGQKIIPVEKAGVYVPGGTAAYPSTVLMNVVPALVAGVKDITLCTPTKNGVIKDEILAAAKLCGISRIIKCGGAQAIAAMTYGTESVPAVDKIAGPGNIYVALAKKAVYGDVGIDMVAGPSEILIIADDSANPDFIAGDMLSQAEHDALAASALVTTSYELALKVQSSIEKQIENLERKDIARRSIDDNGQIIVVSDLDCAVKISNDIAPEHLELYVREPFALLESVKNAGSVFLGGYTPEPIGDYFAGANHTLPTGGSARFSSALSIDDFIKKIQYIYYPKDAALESADKIAEFAKREGLDGHAKAVLLRKNGEK